jgi:hypothetical protein
MMKFIFCISILFSSAISYGQLYKNNWVLGGTGSFSQRDVTYTAQTIEYDSKHTQLTISPSVGYFLLDKLSIGIKSSLKWEKSKAYEPGGGESNITRFYGGPVIRYYLLEMDRQFNIATEGTAQFGRYLSGIQKGPISRYSIMAGPVIFFNSSVGLEFLVGYFSNVENAKPIQKYLERGIQMEIGLQFYLENKD